MTPSARVQAAIEIVDAVIAAAAAEGPPADVIVARDLKARRYAGAKDRRAIRELVFEAIRAAGERPPSGRAAVYGLEHSRAYFDGSPYGPAPFGEHERAAKATLLPIWLRSELSGLVSDDELPALLERAPLDLRVNVARADRDQIVAEFEGSSPTPISPWGVRLPADSRLDEHPAFASGLVEVQDEGSQLIALACQAKSGDRMVDLCAGAGGKSLALAAAAPGADILATDSNRARLAKLLPRAMRAGARIETRLLSPPNELAELHDRKDMTDLVLVDAPCSGSGTWRRNPEGRWRLTPDRLDRLIATQRRVLDIAADLVRPGGHLVYAVCSLLSREGAAQIDGFLIRHSSWQMQDIPAVTGRQDGPGRLLTPGHDGTDGFFVARLTRPC